MKAAVRIKCVHKPPISSIDGIRLDHFEAGCLYDVGSTLGALFLAERWAEPIANEEPALLVPLSQAAALADCVNEVAPANLVREVVPPYFDHLGSAGNLERRQRPRQRVRSPVARLIRVPANRPRDPRRQS